MAGSEIRILISFRGSGSPVPLCGRGYAEIRMGGLSLDKSLEFLEAGFAEAGGPAPPRAELEEAASSLGGLIGWLTAYGYHRLGTSHRETLGRVVPEGAEMARQPARTKYLAILKALDKPRR